MVIKIALDRSGLVGFWDFTKGHSVDQSGQGNNGTLSGNEGFVKSELGWSYQSTLGGSAGLISISDDSSLQLTEGTFVIFGNLKNAESANGRFISKRDAGGTNYELYMNSGTTTFLMNDGVNIRSIALTQQELETSKTIIVTKSSGSSTFKLYLDGVYKGAGSDVNELTADDATLYIGNAYSGSAALNKKLYAIAIYNTEKTATQVASIHKEVIKLKTINTGKRPRDSSGSVNTNKWSGMVSGWNMEKSSSGKIMDVKNVNHGTITPGVIQERTPWGEPCMFFDGVSGKVDCGNDSSLDFTTETFGGWCWVKKTTNTNFVKYLSRGDYQVDGYYLENGSTNVSRFTTNQAAANQTATGSTVLQLDRWYLTGFVSVAGGNNYVYLNGADDTSGSTSRTNPTTNTRVFNIGATSIYNDHSIAPPVIGTFSSQADYETQIVNEYNRVANKVIYKEDFESSAVMQTAIGAGSTLPGTNVLIDSGTWKISTDTVNGKVRKVLQCVTAGVCNIPLPQGNSSYGTFECYMYSAVDANQTIFGFSDDKTQANSYLYYTFPGQTNLALFNGSSNIMGTADGTFTSGTWIKLKFTRNTENSFTMYLNDVAVTAISGTNPVTDNNHTSAKYIRIDGDAGDKFALIEKKFGVEI